MADLSNRMLSPPHLPHESVVGSKLLSPRYPRSRAPFSLMLTRKTEMSTSGHTPSGVTDKLKGKFHHVCQEHRVTLQWVPSQCGILGKELADQLAMRGAAEHQTQNQVTLHEQKTLIKAIIIIIITVLIWR